MNSELRKGMQRGLEILSGLAQIADFCDLRFCAANISRPRVRRAVRGLCGSPIVAKSSPQLYRAKTMKCEASSWDFRLRGPSFFLRARRVAAHPSSKSKPQTAATALWVRHTALSLENRTSDSDHRSTECRIGHIGEGKIESIHARREAKPAAQPLPSSAHSQIASCKQKEGNP
jgi:hypothetical protein